MEIVKTEVFHLTEEEKKAFICVRDLVDELYNEADPDGELEYACIEARDGLAKVYRLFREG